MHNYLAHGSDIFPHLILVFVFMLVVSLYILAVIVSNRRYKKWLLYRTFFWILGVLCIAMVVVGPIADQSHQDFTVHMIGHLLLGMLAPLLIVLAAPMTLLLRTLNVTLTRDLSRLLKSWPVHIYSHPIVASILNIGGLWVLYTTELYAQMQHNILLHILIHLHIFFAGYLFTVSMIYIDPIVHRKSFTYRAIVMVIALAGHGILTKYTYAHPPKGVPALQAENGAMLMYYGGDAIDLILIFIFCFQWYRAMRPREPFRYESLHIQ
ncbi:cytochrome c oxidase assembly protein [Bacillus sp. V3B]|uniref:cytochrome c oxidase assembly protein n=1 Tax=Bacillus sp. V3B TaxID=2804915 RepID=UPI0035C74C65